MQAKRISVKAHANLLLGLFSGLCLAMLVFPAAAQTVFAYDAVGNTMAIASGGLVTDFGFDGYYYHTNSGLYLTWYRAYDPDAGRWLNRDPIEEAGGMNLYGYVGNDPINRVDPLGLSFWGDVGDAEYNLYSSIGNFFTGSQNSGPAQDPNSIGALSANAGYGFHPLYDDDGNALGNPAYAVGGTVLGSLVDFASYFFGGGEAKGLKCEAKLLQKIFDKHGADFGLTGNWNPSRLKDVAKALGSHVDDPAVQKISGTYRGTSGFNYVNPTTGVNVFTDTAGNVIAAWKLGADQLQSVLKTGRLF